MDVKKVLAGAQKDGALPNLGALLASVLLPLALALGAQPAEAPKCGHSSSHSLERIALMAPKPMRAFMRTIGFVCSTSALTLPLGADAELQCDRGSLLDCASQALTQAPLNASAQELVVLGLETLIARSPGAQIAELAGLEDEARVRAAADAVGGFVCDGGRTLRRSRAT